MRLALTAGDGASATASRHRVEATCQAKHAILDLLEEP